jgi:hypothetical protein
MVAQSGRNRLIDTSTATLPLHMPDAHHTAQLAYGMKGRALPARSSRNLRQFYTDQAKRSCSAYI